MIARLLLHFLRLELPTTGLFMEGVWAVGMITPHLAVTSRRLHDTGHSFWWQVAVIVGFSLLALGLYGVPESSTLSNTEELLLAATLIICATACFFLILWLLILLCERGESGTNRYGKPAPDVPE
jgi:uncharacterized membrane protein YhaH (DUF805 family)